MLTTEHGYGDYLFKSTKWFFGNFFFGIFPLFFVYVLNKTTPGHIGEEELNSMVYGGVVLFVALAVMGAVVIDYLLLGVKLGGGEAFAVFIFPFILLFIVSIQYLLIITHFYPKIIFNLDSFTTYGIFISSTVYCIAAKANLSLREDIKNG